MDIREFHRRSVQATVEIVSQIGDADLDRPTPCAEWRVRDLLAHQIVQNHGFAYAASGRRSELPLWSPCPLGDEPVAEYAASADAVVAAFGADGVLDRRLWLPEILGDRPIPAESAIRFHFLDCVVHAWDFAKALGSEPPVPAELAELALPIATAVPDGPEARGPGRAFRAATEPPAGASVLDRVVAALGRTPGWHARLPSEGSARETALRGGYLPPQPHSSPAPRPWSPRSI